MRPIAIDLRTPSSSLFAWVGVGAIWLLAMALVGAAVKEQLLVRRLMKEHATLTAQLAETPFKAVSPAASAIPYGASAQQLLEESTAQWPSLLVALETVAMHGIRLSSIEMTMEQRNFRIQVEFDDYHKLLDYIEELNRGETLEVWKLQTSSTAQGSEKSGSAVIAAKIRN